jgi:hypothetical protein
MCEVSAVARRASATGAENFKTLPGVIHAVGVARGGAAVGLVGHRVVVRLCEEHVEVRLSLVPERVPEEVHLLKSRRQAPPRQRSKMTCRSPRNVILAERERAPFAAHYESLPIGPGYTDWWTRSKLSARVFTCLYRAGTGGIVREPEGIATPLPGKSSERPWSKR